MNFWLLRATYLAECRDEHTTWYECDTCGQGGEQSENHEDVADVRVAHVDELVADDVVAVVGASGGRHRVAVKVEDASDDCEDWDELKRSVMIH